MPSIAQQYTLLLATQNCNILLDLSVVISVLNLVMVSGWDRFSGLRPGGAFASCSRRAKRTLSFAGSNRVYRFSLLPIMLL